MKKQKRIFRDKFGRFASDGRKIKSVQIGKHVFRKKSYVKKLFKQEKKKLKFAIRKREGRPIERIEPKLEFKQEIYQTQLGKLDASHTHKFEHITTWDEVNTESKLVMKFKIFYDQVKNIPKRASDVKFGIQAEDTETSQFISQYTGFTDLIFDKQEIKELFKNIKDFVNALLLLSQRYMVQIKQAIITLIIHFKLKGHL